MDVATTSRATADVVFERRVPTRDLCDPRDGDCCQRGASEIRVNHDARCVDHRLERRAEQTVELDGGGCFDAGCGICRSGSVHAAVAWGCELTAQRGRTRAQRLQRGVSAEARLELAYSRALPQLVDRWDQSEIRHCRIAEWQDCRIEWRNANPAILQFCHPAIS